MAEDRHVDVSISDVFEPAHSLVLTVARRTTVGQLKQCIYQQHTAKPDKALQRLVLYGKVLSDDAADIDTLLTAAHLPTTSKAPVFHLVYKGQARPNASATSMRPEKFTSATACPVSTGLSDGTSGAPHVNIAQPSAEQREQPISATTSDACETVSTQLQMMPVHPVMAAAYTAALAALTNEAESATSPVGTLPFPVQQMPVYMMPAYMVPPHKSSSSKSAALQCAPATVHTLQYAPYHPGTFMVCHTASQSSAANAWRTPQGELMQQARQTAQQPLNGAVAPAAPRRAIRARIWTFRINIRALIKFLVMFVMLYPHISFRRAGMLVVAMIVLFAAQMNSIQRFIRRFMHMPTPQVLRRDNDNVQAREPAQEQAPAAQPGRNEDATQAENTTAAEAAQPARARPSLFREIGVLLFGFVASLLPNFNADAADAAAIAAAQQAMMRDPAVQNQGAEEQAAAIM